MIGIIKEENMGYGAYRIGVKFTKKIGINIIEKKLEEMGGIILEKKTDSSQWEFNFEDSIIEASVGTIKDERIILENLLGNNEEKVDKFNEETIGEGIISFRFAKANKIQVIGRLMNMLKILNSHMEIIGIIDLEAKVPIDLENYIDFTSRVIKAKKEFREFFPGEDSPIRCKDVFK